MDAFEFRQPPSYVTLGDGVGMAATYLRKTWEFWIVPVVGFAIVGGLLTGFMGNAAAELGPGFRSLPRDQQLSQVTGLIVPAFGLTGILAILGLIASWFYAALAIHGLRGRPITADWVLGAGIKSLAGSLLLGLVGIALWIAYALLVVATGGILLIALIGIIPGAIYVAIRLYFWTLAIFDGAGVIESFRVSWELSRGAVLRMLGWGIAFALLAMVVGFAMTIVRLPFVFLPAVSAFIGQLSSGLLGVFTLYGGAVLYESQRWRNVPPAGAPSAYPGYPGASGLTGGYPGYPPQPGYPPMAYPGGAYSQPWGVPSTAPVPPVYPAPADPFAPPAPPTGAAPAASATPGVPPPLVPWAPVQPQPTWSPPPASGWTPPPQSGWLAPAPSGWTPAPASTSAPATTPPTVDAAAPQDDAPTEPYTPPPAG